MQGYPMKLFFQSILWNSFFSGNASTLVSKFHCVCFSSIKKCVYKEKISSNSENLIALTFINKIFYS